VCCHLELSGVRQTLDSVYRFISIKWLNMKCWQWRLNTIEALAWPKLARDSILSFRDTNTTDGIVHDFKASPDRWWPLEDRHIAVYAGYRILFQRRIKFTLARIRSYVSYWFSLRTDESYAASFGIPYTLLWCSYEDHRSVTLLILMVFPWPMTGRHLILVEENYGRVSYGIFEI
jgi:hypothetical protein